MTTMTSGIPETPSSYTEEEVEEVVKAWLQTLRTPSVTSGFVWEDDNFLNISTTWSVADVTKKERISFVKSYGVLKSSLRWSGDQEVLETKDLIVTSPDAVLITGKKVCFSNDGMLKAVVLDNAKASNGGSEGSNKPEVLQIWNRSTLLKSYDLAELNQHKFIYMAFGTTMAWSPNGKKLVYVAEKKVPKLKPFFTTFGKKSEEDTKEKSTDSNKNEINGEEFALKQSWGEQLNDMYNSVVVVLDIETDEFKLLDLPDDQFPVDVQWTAEDIIVGTTYKINDWRLGLIFCSNRESRIFKVNVDGSDFTFLSEPEKAASSPRVRPDGKYVIWQEREIDKPHAKAMNIIGTALDGKQSKPTQLRNISPSDEILAFIPFGPQGWTPDSKRFFFVTLHDGKRPLLELVFNDDFSSASCQPVFGDQQSIDRILWMSEKYVLVLKNTTIDGPSLELVDISVGTQPRRAIVTPLTPEFAVSPKENNICYKTLYGKSTCPSFLIGPNLDSAPLGTLKLIVMPHGGPHSAYSTVYNLDLAFFLRLGFAVLQINYVGSLGTRKDETEELLGFIGTKDVEDCHNILKQALMKYPCLDSSRVSLFGGSHGGFLVAHLTSYAPDAYKAAVMINPVCDLNTMIATSDITDWVVAEAGLPFPDVKTMSFIPAARSLEEAKKYMECSPITNVSKVKAPTLLLLGTEDLRVPMSQGMAYYRALKAHGKIAQVRVYPDCHPLYKVNVMTDSMMHATLWLKKFLK